MGLQASSSFRRSGQRDDRRRRLLADELSNADDWPEHETWSDDAPSPQRSHYGDTEFLYQQLRLLDLIPRRAIALASLLVLGAAILAGLEASYAWMLGRAANGGEVVIALDLSAKGSLGCWFSSLLLLAGSVTAVLIYSVRRHRTDDYQGRYRIWLWAAACLFLMATDQAASLREAFRGLMIALTSTPLVGDGSLWWAIFYAFMFGAIGSRMLIDMWSCRPSIVLLITAAIAHSAAMAGRLGWIQLPNAGHQIMSVVGTEIAANMLILAAMTLYARHVLFDAEGLLPQAEPKESTEDEEDVEKEPPVRVNDRWTKVDAPHTPPQPVYQRPAAIPAPAASPSSASAYSPVNRKLTKDEKKALKARIMRERAERERRGL